MRIPVSIRTRDHVTISQNIVVTMVRDVPGQKKVGSGPGVAAPGPLVLIAHGRPASADERLRMGQVKYPGNAVWLAQHGYVVAVPTRIGYGSTGGPDLDYTGECNNKDYLSGLTGAAEQYRQVLRYLQHLPFVDTRHTAVIGESFGGLVALALSSDAAIQGVINFSGGDGGDYSHLDQPCAPERLQAAFAGLAHKNRVPTLWLYSLNDRFWGPAYPQHWFDAFVEAGGRAKFVQLPADKNNGHFIFNRNGLAWHASVEQFFSQIGIGASAKTDAASQ